LGQVLVLFVLTVIIAKECNGVRERKRARLFIFLFRRREPETAAAKSMLIAAAVSLI
jgi:hypothetical protein